MKVMLPQLLLLLKPLMFLYKRITKQHSLFHFQKYYCMASHQKSLKKINSHGKYRKVFFWANKLVKIKETRITNTRGVVT